MKYKALKSILASLAIVVSTVSNAALIETTADLTITGVSGDYASITSGDIFNFSAIYDDAGIRMKETDTRSSCIVAPSAPIPDGCFFTYNEDVYNFLSDATLNLQSMMDLEAMDDDGFEFYERTGYDKIGVFQDSTELFPTVDVRNDTMYSYWEVENSGAGSVKFYYQNDEGSNERTTVYFDVSNVVSKNAAAIPEPSTLAVFALGLIALASRRVKYKS